MPDTTWPEAIDVRNIARTHEAILNAAGRAGMPPFMPGPFGFGRARGPQRVVSHASTAPAPENPHQLQQQMTGLLRMLHKLEDKVEDLSDANAVVQAASDAGREVKEAQLLLSSTVLASMGHLIRGRRAGDVAEYAMAALQLMLLAQGGRGIVSAFKTKPVSTFAWSGAALVGTGILFEARRRGRI